jgi:hypothetical protein
MRTTPAPPWSGSRRRVSECARRHAHDERYARRQRRRHRRALVAARAGRCLEARAERLTSRMTGADEFCVADRSYSLTMGKSQAAKGGTVHAALVRLTVDPERAPAAAEALVSDILPRVRSASGFVAGYWLEPADGQGFSIVLFETEEQAREAAPPVTSWAAPGIAITDVEFRGVAATA